MLIFAPILRH